VDTWNAHLVDAIRKSDKKKEKPAAPEVESPASETIERGILEAQKDLTEIENSGKYTYSTAKFVKFYGVFIVELC